MPLIWPGFALTEGSDRTGDLIEVVDYDVEWPARFQGWRDRIASALGGVALSIEHIGSTSVPGLPAKPIIDIQVSVADLLGESLYVAPLEATGLQLRSRDNLHRFFRPYPDRLRDVHVHVCQSGSDWEREHLLFRDLLRSNQGACAAYAAAKRQAAASWADDGWAYTDAKSQVILAIMDAAE